MRYRDVGNAVAAAMLDSLDRALDTLALEHPAIMVELAGTGPALGDACQGLMWVRVGGVFPTDGSGTQFTAARPSWKVPAWAYPLEVGVLWCHQNITEDGSYISPKAEQEYAARDDQYRLCVTHAVAELFPVVARTHAGLGQAVLGQSIRGWQPVGPDGGFSGGIFAVTVIAGALSLCTDVGPVP